MEMEIRSVIGGEVEEWAVVEMVARARCMNGEFEFSLFFVRERETRWMGRVVE